MMPYADKSHMHFDSSITSYTTPHLEAIFGITDYATTLATVMRMGGCDLVCTSPPYENARTYGADVSWALVDYAKLGDAVFAALKPGGHCLMVLDGPVRKWRKDFGSERSLTPWRVMLDWADRVGFRVPDRLAYGRFGVPGEYKGRFRNDWEPLFWFQKPGADGFFDKWALAEEANWGAGVGNVCNNTKPDGTMRHRRQTGKATELGLKHRGTLWDYGSVGHGHDDLLAEATKHPARFSRKLAEDIVKCFCPIGGLVCDPMSGSGTTAVASVSQQRKFIGGDLLADAHGKPWAQVGFERTLAELTKTLV